MATRTFDNFIVFVPVTDAAIFASQSLEVRHDRVIREDSGGTIWSTPSDYRGDYLLIPPDAGESRTVRIIAKGSRGNLDSMPDSSSADNISGRLTITERFLHVPE